MLGNANRQLDRNTVDGSWPHLKMNPCWISFETVSIDKWDMLEHTSFSVWSDFRLTLFSKIVRWTRCDLDSSSVCNISCQTVSVPRSVRWCVSGCRSSDHQSARLSRVCNECLWSHLRRWCHTECVYMDSKTAFIKLFYFHVCVQAGVLKLSRPLLSKITLLNVHTRHCWVIKKNGHLNTFTVAMYPSNNYLNKYMMMMMIVVVNNSNMFV